MRIIFTITFLLTISLTASSQDSHSSNQTTTLCGGRWELFMSEITARVTFKIDKFSGDVFVLVQQPDKTVTWELIPKEQSIEDNQKQDSINYQLFSSGMSIRYTYLVNTNSGLTWQLVTDEKGSYHFQTIE